jgi:hypothetical protein
LGSWARRSADCARPEFVFGPTTATLQLDADGASVTFTYPDVTYETKGPGVIAHLGKPHPIAKTADKTSLEFILPADDGAELQLLKHRSIKLVRCPTPPRN